MVIRSFKKCGITTDTDGFEDDQVNIRGLEGYKLPLPEEEYHLETSSSEEENEENDGSYITADDESSDDGKDVTDDERCDDGNEDDNL